MTSKEALEILFTSDNYCGDYQSLIEARMKLEKDLERLENLQKVIENIKELPKCDICDAQWHIGCMCLKKSIMKEIEKKR